MDSSARVSRSSSPDSRFCITQHPPTDVFQFTYGEGIEVMDTVQRSSQHKNLSRRHSHCKSNPVDIGFTPGSQIVLKHQVFKDLHVCWDCEGFGAPADSPSKRKSSKYRFSSLKSALPPPELKSCTQVRYVSEGAKLPVRTRLKVARTRATPSDQENVPYSPLMRLSAQFDGTSESIEDVEMKISSSKVSPNCNVDTKTPDEDMQSSKKCSEFQVLDPDIQPCTPSHGLNTMWQGRRSLVGSYDLTLPSRSAFSDPFESFSDLSTPLTRASPAKGAFPFPTPEKSPSSLTPFVFRSGSSPIRSNQGLSSLRRRSRSLTPSQRPDRFIPARKTSHAFKESLHVTKSPQKLTAAERTLRSNDHGPDPFSRNVPRTPPRINPRRIGTTPVPASRAPNNVFGVRHTLASPGMRQISNGAVWSVGGRAALGDSVAGISDGRRGLMASGTNAPLYSANFLARVNAGSQLEVHERRLALALDLDPASRMLNFQHSPSTSSVESPDSSGRPDGTGIRVWKDNQWIQEGSVTLLDAPSLRDDFYCSLLAYSPTAGCLAVGLGSHVYLWTESQSETPDSMRTSHTAHVASLDFSSAEGEKAILAIGRADGHIMLWSPTEHEHRFDSLQPCAVCCVSFRPTTVKRKSLRDPYITVDTEELLVGDEVGHVYFYSVEWPNQDQRELFGWAGALTLIARITGHTQQICGLAWSLDGQWFATGGNDNACQLYETKRVLQAAHHTSHPPAVSHPLLEPFNSRGISMQTVDLSASAFAVPPTTSRHKWSLQAAVKAIAFCPWQKGLLAVGGGSNDRCIHFYHTISGACLATIDCSAQVTSLIWSTTRREIAATFGFAQPDHPYRIAVFAWPSCRQIVAIPWYDEHRALYAIAYPGGPNVGRTRGEGGMWWSRTQEEGCLVVATSDCSIKFHEIWAEEKRATASKGGLLGGSDILEALHGIDKVGEVIR